MPISDPNPSFEPPNQNWYHSSWGTASTSASGNVYTLPNSQPLTGNTSYFINVTPGSSFLDVLTPYRNADETMEQAMIRLVRERDEAKEALKELTNRLANYLPGAIALA